jgi:Flp pilus assembly pilin Flp
MTMRGRDIGEFWRCQRGQTTTEYMLLIAVIVAELVLAYVLLVPALRDGFVDLAKRIMDNKP